MGLRILIFFLFVPLLAEAQQWQQLNQKTAILIKEERYNEAILMAELAMKAAKKENVAGNQLAVACYNLASAYFLSGQLDKPENLYQQAATLYKNNSGEQSAEYANALRALGEYYTIINSYRRADSLFTIATNIFVEIGQTTGKEYALLENCKGDLFNIQNRPMEAEAAYKKAAQTEKARTGEESADYCTYMNNLAKLYFDLGRYEQAEPFFLKVKDIRKKVLGENHTQYASILSSLAEFYGATGQYEKAVVWFTEALRISREVYGPDHFRFAILVKKSADFALRMNQFNDAELLFTKALSVFKNTTGEHSLEYGSCCNGLGLLYANQGQYANALMYYAKAKEIIYNKFGDSHPDYGSCLNNLALLYVQLGNYSLAEKLYLQAAAIDRKDGDNTNNYPVIADNLVKLYTASRQYAKAVPLIRERNSVAIKNLFAVFSVLSGKEKEQYLENQLQITAANNSFLYLQNNPLSEIAAENFNLQLQLKSLALTDTRNITKAIRESKDSSVIRQFNEWQQYKAVLAREYSLVPAKRRPDINTLEEKAELLEKELNRLSVYFRQQQQANTVYFQQLQQKMDEQEAAVEFVSFPLYNKHWTDSVIYAAYILRKNDSLPRFVTLCEENQLGKFFSANIGANGIKSLYRSDPVDETDKPSISGDSLYALVWKPLQPYLNGIKRIHYSPSGLLNRVAFQALPANDSQILADLYELNRYINLREMVMDSVNEQLSGSAVLFGDCRYDADSIDVQSSQPASGWKQLPGTARELSDLQEVFASSAVNATAFKGAAATEEVLKSFNDHAPAVLHFATHGFFLPDPVKKMREGFATDQRNAFTTAGDPLLRSGIVLSGANHAWMGLPVPEGKEDGIVTAYEIAGLNLRNTQLVVLSACETALGDIKGTEGVFGLQRAFKSAGVSKMILSLWKVPDAETATLMKIFYKQYLQGKPIREAFRNAQQEMRKTHAPYYWAGFVLIE